MRTSELTGAALQHAVMLAEGWAYFPATEGQCALYCRTGATPTWTVRGPDYLTWAQAGPILDRESICIRGTKPGFTAWVHEQRATLQGGSTQLEAAMRCFVFSKLGDEVELPEELK